MLPKVPAADPSPLRQRRTAACNAAMRPQSARRLSRTRCDTEDTASALADIAAERDRQRADWGADHDGSLWPEEWAELIAAATAQLSDAASGQPDIEAVSEHLVNTAAVCVAALEALRRRP